MRIDRVDLHIVRLPLIQPFRTSTSLRRVLEHVVVRVYLEGGVEGWGESPSATDPYYCAETTQTCWHMLHDFLVPAVLGQEWGSIAELSQRWEAVRGNEFAKSGLEMACWDALGKARGISLAALLGGTRSVIDSGVSLGIHEDLGRTFGEIDRFLAEGYKRIKLKIAPGHDVEVVRRVRERYPELPLQVDAKSA
jgi:O-succinylbenzoate synthase